MRSRKPAGWSDYPEPGRHHGNDPENFGPDPEPEPGQLSPGDTVADVSILDLPPCGEE